jgi:segregation and condensation protein B
MDQHLITRIVEAALLAANQPLSLAQLHGLFTLDEPAPDGSVERALEALQAACDGRGVELVQVASGWRYQVREDVHAWVARLWTERQTRYTRATLETLALIAYRQPITRGEIEQVRGVAVSTNIIKALEEREWIRVVGHRDVPGRPALFGTTKAFLDYFGLKRLDELPPLSELKEIGELEPQLQFDGEASPIPAGGVDAGRDAGDAGAANDKDIDPEKGSGSFSEDVPQDAPFDSGSENEPDPFSQGNPQPNGDEAVTASSEQKSHE